MMAKVENLKEVLQRTVDAYERMLAEFKMKLEIDPHAALGRVQGMISQSQRAQVAEKYLGTIGRWEQQEGNFKGWDETKILTQIHVDLVRKVAQGARFPNRSTSPISNFCQEENLSGYAEILQDWKFLV